MEALQEISAGSSQQTALTDEEIVGRVRAGEHRLFELLMRRHNRQIYRAARAVVHDESETEEVMQDAYVRAFEHLREFEGRSRFSTWLTRIALHEAFARSRRRKRFEALDSSTGNLECARPPGAIRNKRPATPRCEACSRPRLKRSQRTIAWSSSCARSKA